MKMFGKRLKDVIFAGRLKHVLFETLQGVLLKTIRGRVEDA